MMVRHLGPEREPDDEGDGIGKRRKGELLLVNCFSMAAPCTLQPGSSFKPSRTASGAKVAIGYASDGGEIL